MFILGSLSQLGRHRLYVLVFSGFVGFFSILDQVGEFLGGEHPQGERKEQGKALGGH
jgi:hypothetical protein